MSGLVVAALSMQAVGDVRRSCHGALAYKIRFDTGIVVLTTFAECCRRSWPSVHAHLPLMRDTMVFLSGMRPETESRRGPDTGMIEELHLSVVSTQGKDNAPIDTAAAHKELPHELKGCWEISRRKLSFFRLTLLALTNVGHQGKLPAIHVFVVLSQYPVHCAAQHALSGDRKDIVATFWRFRKSSVFELC